MLSQNLQSLLSQLEEHKQGGRSLDTAGMVCTCMILRAAVADARALEAQAVPPRARIDNDDLPGNVVRLAEILLKNGVTVGPRPADGASDGRPAPGPEDAA